MSFLRNDRPKTYSMDKRRVRFSILTPNPLIRKKVTHDSEVSKYRDKVDERYSRYDRKF